MNEKYVISIDQSTQGTKALLLNSKGMLVCRTDKLHRQLIDVHGWVSHDLAEIYQNTLEVVRKLIEKSGVSKKDVCCVGISNQRETTAIWDRTTGEPLDYAVVWQCGRASELVEKMEKQGWGEIVRNSTGIPLSAYFPAAKMKWLLQYGEEYCTMDRETIDRMQRAKEGNLCLGTIDSWLIFKLTTEHAFCTDYSNASRTQLFNIHTLKWDDVLCNLFEIPKCCLAKVCDSDALYGYTTFEGFFETPLPICGVLGDSHGALFGHGCVERGMVKATYGTGSSLMMHIGDRPIIDKTGLVTSLAWSRNGIISYVLEGNLNYAGAIITWLKDELQLIQAAAETNSIAIQANPQDHSYLVPAFTGLGAPYWEERASAVICGMSRTTGKAELVKASLDSIAYQITDLICAMEQDAQMSITELRVDGGPTGNTYLMQFQSDISGKLVSVANVEELSGIGAAYMAGSAIGLYAYEALIGNISRTEYHAQMSAEERNIKYEGWKQAVAMVLQNANAKK